ncbi:hypothetical protein TW85_10675 [Marinomonas sp. S3726]|uniref:hypothetical protein n=1 Tax=Marinomonas sp. S3726 TaxID=579484 RepID=UPI0005FA34C7|nr:hypothetical protein [Marinomonas sp. S3726]KJZ13674.1 hypothetical protein TW85_10675 [Marinomonas sp. S3726]
MRTFRGVSKKKQLELISQYSVLETDDGRLEGWHCLAISVFDHWLDRDEFICLFNHRKVEEQNSIDAQWLTFYQHIALVPDLYMAKHRSLGRVLFKEPRNSDLLVNRLKIQQTQPFVQLVFPKFKAIYVQGDDDTHILYFECHDSVSPLLDIIKISGLHILPLKTK